MIQLPPRAAPPSLTIEHENLEEKIYSRLKTLILERHIQPGERLQIDRLAREMGVSRTPVLNALKRLAQEQVVDWISRRGIYLKRFTKRELARLFEVREMLEGLSARRAATRITQEEVKRLTQMFRRLDLSPTPEALARYIDRDRYFHRRLVEVSGNQHLAHAIDSVNLMIFTYQHGLARPPKETIQEHWAILDALRRRDPEASEAAMRVHMRRSVERMDKEADIEEARAG